MFIEGRAKKHDPNDLAHLIEVGGVDHTIVSSDLGLMGSPRPTEGFRSSVRMLLDLQVPKADIRRLSASMLRVCSISPCGPPKHDVAMSKT
jgi:hypothetical protein